MRSFCDALHFERMANQVNPSSLEDDSDNSKSELNDFNWSLRPVSTFFSLIGIDLPPCHKNRVFRWFAFIFNLSVHLYLIVFLACDALRISNLITNKFSFTHTWNLITDYCNFTVHALGVHWILLTVTRVKWLRFWSLLTQIAERVESNGTLILKFRRVSYYLIAYILTQVSGPIT